MRMSLLTVVCLELASTGCVQKEFQDVKAQNIMSSAPIHLDAEQVSLTGQQLDCGVQADLWEPPTQVQSGIPGQGGGISTARLLAAGRALQFDDDVVVSETGFRQPYVQVRGDFMMNLADGPNVHEKGEDERIVDGRLSVIINHSCFSDSLPVLGVRKGKFTQDAPPVMEFRLDDKGWHFVKLVH